MPRKVHQEVEPQIGIPLPSSERLAQFIEARGKKSGATGFFSTLKGAGLITNLEKAEELFGKFILGIRE